MNPKVLPRELAGREFDAELLAELPPDADPCAEKGEFHSFAYAGPMFAQPLSIETGIVVERDGFVFCDLVQAEYARGDLPAIWQPAGEARLCSLSAPAPGAGTMTFADIQAALNRLGASPTLAVDGLGGDMTTIAIKAFQAKAVLAIDGICGPETVAAIEKALS